MALPAWVMWVLYELPAWATGPAAVAACMPGTSVRATATPMPDRDIEKLRTLRS